MIEDRGQQVEEELHVLREEPCCLWVAITPTPSLVDIVLVATEAEVATSPHPSGAPRGSRVRNAASSAALSLLRMSMDNDTLRCARQGAAGAVEKPCIRDTH